MYRYGLGLNRIKYPGPALLKGRQPRSTFFHPVCVRFGATAAHSRLVSFASMCVPLRLLSSDPIPAVAIRHRRLPTRAFRPSVVSLPPRFWIVAPSYTRGSEDNNSRTPLPVTLARVLLSERARVLFLQKRTLNSRADPHSAVQSLYSYFLFCFFVTCIMNIERTKRTRTCHTE